MYTRHTDTEKHRDMDARLKDGEEIHRWREKNSEIEAEANKERQKCRKMKEGGGESSRPYK
jgi:hypothetical protein